MLVEVALGHARGVCESRRTVSFSQHKIKPQELSFVGDVPCLGFMPRAERFRISVVGAHGTLSNKCPKCTVDSCILVPPSHSAIARVALNKLKLKVKDERRVQLFLKTAVREHAVGTELPFGDVSEYLANDCVVSVLVRQPEKPDRSSRVTASFPQPAASQPPDVSEGMHAMTLDAVSSVRLDVFTMPDILVVISARLGLRDFFRLSRACRTLRDAVMQCDSGPWWHDACARWSPLLPALKANAAPDVSWRQLLERQAMEARRAWRDEHEYALVLSVDTEPEPGLPRAAMSGVHLLPFVVPPSGGTAAVVTPLVSSSLVTYATAQPGRPPSSNVARCWLLRKADGAILDLLHACDGRELELQSSSGLTGGAGASKQLRIVFEPFDNADDLFRRVTTEDVQGQVPVHERKNDRKPKHPLLPRASIALRFLLPRADAAPTSGRTLGHAGLYAEPVLEAVELAQLPLQSYWDVEEVPRALWQRPTPDTSAALAAAVTASGVDVLAEAWQRPAVLAALASRMHKIYDVEF